MVVIDEAHEERNSDSAQGHALTVLVNASRRALLLTGTLSDGMASSLYNVEFLLNPWVRRHYPWRDEHGKSGIAAWTRDMGELVRVSDYRIETGKASGVTRRPDSLEERPGCSPLLTRLINGHTLHIELANLGIQLPPMRWITRGVDPTPVQQTQYLEVIATLNKLLPAHPKLFGPVQAISRFWLTAPFHEETVSVLDEDGMTRRVVFHCDGLPQEAIYPKEQALLDLVRAELAEGRPCIVYVEQTDKRDIRSRLKSLLEKVGARPYVLQAGSTGTRLETIRRSALQGANVLVCHPKLVRTGANLVEWPTIVFYELSPELLVVQQAARRNSRIGQKEEARIYVLYHQPRKPYQGRLPEQKNLAQLAQRELAALRLIGGRGSDGLANIGCRSAVDDLIRDFNSDTGVFDPQALFDHVASLRAEAAVKEAWLPQPEGPDLDEEARRAAVLKARVEAAAPVWVRPVQLSLF